MSKSSRHPRAPSTTPGSGGQSAESKQELAAAQQASYVAFLHRHPWTTDAYELGFVTGVREDYRLQDDQFANVDVPILMLDNDFNDPDLTRYVQRFREYQPQIGVLGDAYSAAEFAADARALIIASHAAGRIPLLVGGTMLYFRALLHGLSELPRQPTSQAFSKWPGSA